MTPNPSPFYPGPVGRGPQGAYRKVLIGVAIVGAFLLPALLCTAATDAQAMPACIATLIIIGLPIAGLLWWLRRRQQQQEAVQAYGMWLAEQERQRRVAYEAQLAEQEHQRRQAYERRLAEQERQRRLLHLKTLGDLLVKTPTEFEMAIVDLLPSLGFVNVQHTGKAGDLGADVQCFTQSGERVIVQCKQYGTGKKVTRPEVQAFMGACMHFNAKTGYFITTGTFTQDARDLAQEHNVRPIDGEMLTKLIQTAQEKLSEQIN